MPDVGLDASKRVAWRLLLLACSAAYGSQAAAQDMPRSAPEAAASEQIVVTATQRPASVRDVPGSVSVFGADRLESAHVTTEKQLTTLAPTMSVINSTGEAFGQLIAVRGVARSGADVGLESAVGISVDGVPLQRPNLSIFDFQGVERVELLRGPQGTLFGVNTTAGIISIMTRRPGFDPHLEVSGTLGEREQRELRVSAEGAVVPTKLAARFDGFMGAVAGYLPNPRTDNVYGGRHSEEARGQLLWTASADLNVRIIADYLHHGGSINSPVYRVVGPTGAIIARLTGVPLIASFHATDLSQIDNIGPRFEFSDSAGVSATADWLIGAGRLTTIVSHRSSTLRRAYDVDNSPADIANDPKDGERYYSSTFETRFQGVRGRFDYLLGVYAARDVLISRDSYTVGRDFEPYINTLAQGAIPLMTGLPFGQNFPSGSGVLDVFRQRATTLAAFTHHIVALTDQLSLVFGLRYTSESKSLAADISSNNPGCANALALHGRTLTGVPAALQGLVCIPNIDPRYDGVYGTERAEGNWSGTFALAEKLTDTLNAYLSFSRGYKSGGFQLDRSGMDPIAPALSQVAFRQETADSVELGLREISADGVWRANGALFYTSFNDYQFSFFTGLNRRTINVPNLSTKGIEAEAGYRPFSSLELSLSGIYQEAVFGNSGFPAGLTQLQGTNAPVAPRWIFVATADFRQPLSELGVTLLADANVRWQSKANVGGSGVPSASVLQDAYALVGARIGVEAPNRNWTVELWARNLFNQRAWSILNNTTLQPGSISGFVIDPRSFGATVTLAW